MARKKKLTPDQKGDMVNQQRVALLFMLSNIMDSPKGVDDNIKSAICSSLINLMDISFIPEDDDDLKQIVNLMIDTHCAYMEQKHDMENYREELESVVKNARKIVDKMKTELAEKARRIKEGNDILKGICLN